MIFIDNKYTYIYYQIISRAQERPLPFEIYTEAHHIIPKSISNDNSKNNLVLLTAREHFLCHWLLTKMTTGKSKSKMMYALWAMSNIENKYHQRYKITSRIYKNIRESISKEFSKNMTGRKLSAETKRKISETRKKKFATGELEIKVYDETREKLSNIHKGRKHSTETKQKISIAHTGKTISEEQKEFLSFLNTGKSLEKKTRQKISNTLKEQYASGNRLPVAGMKGKSLSEEAKQKMRKPKARGFCPHCNKEGPLNSLKRHHYDNCKFKGNIDGYS